jgi:hypothetical protein
MTRVEQRTQKLIETLGDVSELVVDRSRTEAAEVKRAARALASLLKKKPAAAKAPPKAPASRKAASSPRAATATKRVAAKRAPAKAAAARTTKDGRSISEVRRAAAHKAWETKRSQTRKRGR